MLYLQALCHRFLKNRVPCHAVRTKRTRRNLCHPLISNFITVLLNSIHLNFLFVSEVSRCSIDLHQIRYDLSNKNIKQFKIQVRTVLATQQTCQKTEWICCYLLTYSHAAWIWLSTIHIVYVFVHVCPDVSLKNLFTYSLTQSLNWA